MTLSSRRISQILALLVFLAAIAAVLVEDLAPEPGTDLLVYYSTITMVVAGFFAVSFGIVYLMLRLGTRDGATYWATTEESKQAPRIAVLVAVIFCLQTLADSVLAYLGFGTSLVAGITGVVAWTMIPAAFLNFGIVRWPTRISHASRRRLAVGSIIGLGVAATWSFTAYILADTSLTIPKAGSLVILTSALILAAAGEEVVFRALLLTCLISLTKSRFHSVFIASVAFAAMHAPYEFSVPIIYGDWHMLLPIAQDYAGRFVGQVAAGLAFGVLWLRTGSITIVTLSHAMLNVGTMLAHGY